MPEFKFTRNIRIDADMNISVTTTHVIDTIEEAREAAIQDWAIVEAYMTTLPTDDE